MMMDHNYIETVVDVTALVRSPIQTSYGLTME